MTLLWNTSLSTLFRHIFFTFLPTSMWYKDTFWQACTKEGLHPSSRLNLGQQWSHQLFSIKISALEVLPTNCRLVLSPPEQIFVVLQECAINKKRLLNGLLDRKQFAQKQLVSGKQFRAVYERGLCGSFRSQRGSVIKGLLFTIFFKRGGG